MEKKITPCVENVITALRATAKAHNAEFEDWTDEGQVGIAKECVPVFADVQSILCAFYKPEYTLPDMGYGYITAYIYGDECYNDDTEDYENPFLDEVDVETLALALPYGEVEKIAWETR